MATKTPGVTIVLNGYSNNPCWPLDIISGQACYPVTWPSNWEYRCQHGNLHLAERGAIGGDFPV